MNSSVRVLMGAESRQSRTVNQLVNILLGITENELIEPDYKAVANYAYAWFERNSRNFHDWPCEIGFALYWSSEGKVVPGKLVQGETAEVQWPNEPDLGIEIGSIHSHVDCSAELSDFDAEEGQKTADRTGQFYAMFVIGFDDDGNVTMVEEVFEPQTGNKQES